MPASPLCERIEQFLQDRGTPVNGWAGSEEEAISVALDRYPGRPYCTVRSWNLIDIRVTPEERERVRAFGLEPRVVFASRVITDSAARFGRGDRVYTTMQRAYDPNGLFETRNTIYLLLGEGRQKEVDLDVYNALLNGARAGF